MPQHGGLWQEYISPYTPDQNGMIERFFLTLKQECVWLQRFTDRDHALLPFRNDGGAALDAETLADLLNLSEALSNG